jgi:hypothetical protein
MIGPKPLSVRSLRMFALASAAAVMLGLSGALPASAAAIVGLCGALPASAAAMTFPWPCKQVCYWEPTVGKVCEFVCDG